MGRNLQESRRLLILSDTAMWASNEGVLVFEPTLREIESICPLFDEVVWLGYQYQNPPRKNARLTTVSNLRFVLLPKATGGDSFLQKLRIVPFLPIVTWQCLRYFRQFDFIHTRGPSIPALLAILFSRFAKRKKYWHKYAGNWTANGPFFYELQKRWLKRTTWAKVTVNGSNENLPNFYSFLNPCLTSDELSVAKQAADRKKFDTAFTLCFVGRLEEPKGMGNLFSALEQISGKERLKKLIVAGEGDIEYYKTKAAATGVDTEFLGPVSRERLDEVYSQSHFLLLPSKSEGFPKVVSEAMGFGCIPIVSDVSFIKEQVKDGQNGFLLENNSPPEIRSVLERAIGSQNLEGISSGAVLTAKRFDYESFRKRIEVEIFELQS